MQGNYKSIYSNLQNEQLLQISRKKFAYFYFKTIHNLLEKCKNFLSIILFFTNFYSSHMAHYSMPPCDPYNDLKSASYTHHQELELESQVTSADQSSQEAQCWSQLTLNIHYPCLLQPAQPTHQMLEEESYFTFLPHQQEEKAYTAEEDLLMSESSLHRMQDSSMSQCSFAQSNSYPSSCSQSMEDNSLTFGQQYPSSHPAPSQQSSVFPHTVPSHQEPSEASFGSTIPIPHFYQASSFQNPLQPHPIVSTKIEQGVIKSLALDNTKFPIYTDSQIGVQCTGQLTLHLISSNGDEDYESDSETMERSRVLCDGDLRQVEEIMERKGADIMRQKVHNYRRYCRQQEYGRGGVVILPSFLDSQQEEFSNFTKTPVQF